MMYYTRNRIIRELRRLVNVCDDILETGPIESYSFELGIYKLKDLSQNTVTLCQCLVNGRLFEEALAVIEQISPFGIEEVASDCSRVEEKELAVYLSDIAEELINLQCWYMEEKGMFPLGLIACGMAYYDYEANTFIAVNESDEYLIWEKPQQKAIETSENTPNLQEKAEKTEKDLKSYNNNNTRRKGGRPNRRNSSLKECVVGVDADKLLTVLHALIDEAQAVVGVQYITACIHGGLLEKPTGGIIEKEFPHITASNYNKRKKEMTEQEKELKLKVVQELLKQK